MNVNARNTHKTYTYKYTHHLTEHDTKAMCPPTHIERFPIDAWNHHFGHKRNWYLVLCVCVLVHGLYCSAKCAGLEMRKIIHTYACVYLSLMVLLFHHTETYFVPIVVIWILPKKEKKYFLDLIEMYSIRIWYLTSIRRLFQMELWLKSYI